MNYLIFQERSSQQYYRLDIYQREFSSEQLLQATQRLPLFSDFKVENTDDEKDDKGKRKKIRGKKICDEQRRVRKKEKGKRKKEKGKRKKEKGKRKKEKGKRKKEKGKIGRAHV